MKIEFVEISGFRGFRDKARFDFPSGFAILTGRNGTGKSTVLDAVDFALTGTINKFPVRSARGFGLDEHIWWLGQEDDGRPRYVTVGFIDSQGERFVINRTPKGLRSEAKSVINRLCHGVPPETLVRTSLIRDELIVQLSVDLPGQQRFEAVRSAMGGLIGPDYSVRGNEIMKAAEAARDQQRQRLKFAEEELSRSLEMLTEAHSLAERSPDISEALRTVQMLSIHLPEEPSVREEALRGVVADRRRVLAQVGRAVDRSEDLAADYAYFSSPEEVAKVRDAASARDRAAADKQEAEKALALALELQRAEQENDIYAAQYAALLEHGAALGLQDGHCPLCAAYRTSEEFGQAIANARRRLEARTKRITVAKKAVSEARERLYLADQTLQAAETNLQDLEARRLSVDQGLASVREVYIENSFRADALNPQASRVMLLSEQERLARLERALYTLEASSAVDRVSTLESRVLNLRRQVDQELANVAEAERAFEFARQIEASTKTVANQISAEQFDTVVPLLKELCLRLRPHADWTDIEFDFGGRVRASLNFTVAGGHDVKFLFSSGQRRAFGLAFLLAIHLSRRWCDWQTLLLDDPIQHIDDYRAVNLVEVLAAIRRMGRQVIVAAEDSALADVLCRRLRSSVNQPGRTLRATYSQQRHGRSC